MRKILIIEDESPIREGIADLLDLEGYAYQQAHNGREGVEIARSYLPDLILCDINMPDLDGYAVLAELQKSSQTDRIPFIFLTAKAKRADVRRGMSFGADDYIIKPFLASDLLTAIENRLRKFDLLQKAGAEEIDRLRYYINTTLPHELRTPLTSLTGYVDWLSKVVDQLETSQIQDILSRVSKSANRLSRVVENYLLHVQLSAALKDNNMDEQLCELGGSKKPAAEIQTGAYHAAYKHGREEDLELSVADAPVAVLTGNIQKLVEELVDNGCKFSEQGTPLKITAYPQNSHYIIQIQDHGRGMNPKHIPLIAPNRQFERRTYEQQGVGLGLIIVTQITQIYGGELLIKSDVGQGATVTVRLPLMQRDTQMNGHVPHALAVSA